MAGTSVGRALEFELSTKSRIVIKYSPTVITNFTGDNYTVKLKMKHLVGCIENGLLQQFINDNDLPRAARWRNREIWKQCLDKLESYNAERTSILQEFGTEIPGAPGQPSQWNFLKQDVDESGKPKVDETGQPVMVVDNEKAAAFQAAMNEILDVPIEIVGEPFTEDDFAPRKETAAPLPLNAGNLLLLEWYIVPSESDLATLTAAQIQHDIEEEQTSNVLDDAVIETEEPVLELHPTGAEFDG